MSVLERRIVIPHNSEKEEEGCELFVRELIDTEYGFFTWPCAFVLGTYIWNNKELFINKSILEIGSGVGVVGILCAKIARKVILTDNHSNVIQENINNNIHCNQVGHTAEFKPLDWHHWKPDMMPNIIPDWIVASDCFYDSQDFEAIIAVVYYYCRMNPNCKFLCSYQVRNENRTLFPLLCMWDLIVTPISIENNSLEESQEIELFEIRMNHKGK